MTPLRKRWFLRLAFLVGVALAPHPAAASAAPSSGIVVAEVRAGTAGEKAGLLPGDVLVSWRRDPLPVTGLPAAGELALPFDLVEVSLEQMPRARVTLLGRRGTQERSWVLQQGAPAASPGLRTEPLLPDDLRALDRQGKSLLATDDYEAGIAALRSTAERARSRGAAGLAIWFLVAGARELEQGRHWEEADALFSAAATAASSGAAKGAEPGVTAQIYREWGDFFYRRFAWDRARECYQRALDADRRKGFDALGVAWSLEGLGLLDAHTRGAQDEEALYDEAIEIRQRLAPGSAEPATGWLRRGHAPGRVGRWAQAAGHYQKALDLLPDNEVTQLLRAEALANLALVQGANGEAEASRQSWQRAYALVQAAAPEDFLMVGVAQGLGMLMAEQGELARAEELLVQALALFRRHRPGSLDEADVLRELGLLQMRAGKKAAGSGNLCQARDVVNAWWQKLRTDQDVRRWWGRYAARYHRACAASLAELGRGEEAFAAVEEGRARAFLDLRAERGLRLSSLSPQHSAEWRQLNAEYERAQEELRAANARGNLPLERRINLEGRLREIRREKGRFLERGLPAGAVRYPEPLRLAEARRQLDRGTVLLLYSIARNRTLLFVLLPEGVSPQEGGPGWAVLPLEIGGDELGRRVERFRDTLLKDRFNRRAIDAQASALYDLLIAPAEPYLAGAERIAVAPDGALHTLPFAALRRGEQYLIEWKPLHFTLSATVYAQQLANRRGGTPETRPEPRPERLVAFGDPRYLPVPAGQDRSRSVLGDGVPLLPASRPEVEGIASLFPGARVLLGDQVTEEAVREAVPGASLVHFAVHGLFNRDSPVDSALVLSPSRMPGAGGRNGLIEAWEVMENLSLDASLVTLSACDTALGREVGGEGLVSLTRAFHYAGARSVIATLWGISDRSTAGFMKELYGALKEGRSKDEALRAAQLAQIRGDQPQPFYWAAFQLFGDWR